jgi:transposase
MSKSLNLRTWVLAALLPGLSCRQPAIRFGVSASSAIRWHTMERAQAGATPKVVVARPALDALDCRTNAHFARRSM